MTLPDMKSKATFDVSDFRQGAAQIKTDLRDIQDLAKKLGTIRITADLSAGKTVERQARAMHDALDNAVPTDMQARIARMFGGFDTGANSARASAEGMRQAWRQQAEDARAAAQAQREANAAEAAQLAAKRKQLTDLVNQVRIARAEFQSGIGEASPQEIADLTARMRQLKSEVEALAPEVRQTFGEWSREAVAAANATRTAEATIAAANGQISRLGLASQVKLGASAALQQFAPQAGLAANGLVQLAKASETARLSNRFFEKQLVKTNVSLDEGRRTVEQLSGAFNVMPNVTEEAFKVLLRNGYSFQQATEAMKLYAGSALAAGKDVGGAWSALADDVQRGSTIMSNLYGITTNQATAYAQYAKNLRISTDALTAQQKAEAFLTGLRRESSQELQDADAILKGYIGSANQASMELQRGGLELGKSLLPAINIGTRALVGFLDLYNSFPAPVKTVTALLVASTVALGLLALPVTGLVGAYDSLVTAKAAHVAVNAVEATSTARLTVVTTIQRALMMDVGTLYGVLNSKAMLYNGSLAASAAATDGLSAATGRLITTLKGAAAATSIITVAAVAVGALGLYWNQKLTAITATYEQADAENQKIHDRALARAAELSRSGTDLGKAQAKYLLISQQLQEAQQAPVIGANALTGERIYGQVDEARVKKLQADLVTARENVTALFTEAQRRGTLNLKLTDDQTKAVEALNKALAGREFDLKLTGMTDMQRDLAKLGQEFDALRQDFKKPFYVNGVLDVNQTPTLRTGLGQIDAQKLAEENAIRARYAKQAADAATKSALDVQAAEIAAMRDGAAKRQAQRQAELDQITRDAKKQAEQYKGFPAERARIEEDGQKIIAAKRAGWAIEDEQLARENAGRISEAEKGARDAQIAAMAEGRAKKEAQRQAELADLRASIAEKVKALAGDPEGQLVVAAAGQQEINAKLIEQSRQRGEEERAALAQVADARRAAREAEIAAIQDETARIHAQRELEVQDAQKALQGRLDALRGYPQQQAAVLAAAQRQKVALEAKWAQEDAQRAKEIAGRIADAWLKAQEAQFQAEAAGRAGQQAQYELDLSRRLAALKNNAVATAELEGQAVRERAAYAEQVAQAGYAREQQALYANLARALSNDKLSVEERKALWAGYYADLGRLSGQYQADEKARLKQQEQDARDAAEKLRLAYITQANQPIEQSQGRVQELQASLSLAVSDAQVLKIQQDISRERDGQLRALQGQIIGLNGVMLTAEERRKVEAQIRALQHDQAQALKDQLETERALQQSVFDRLTSEAKYAEQNAQNEAERTKAQRQQLAIAQANLRALDEQIAAEGHEKERNALIGQRYTLLTNINELSGKIDSAPLDGATRLLSLYKAQAETRLTLSGLGRDEVATSRLTLQIAAAELRVAAQRVSQARNLQEVEAARQQQAQAQLALAQALVAAQQAEQNKSAQRLRDQADGLSRMLELEQEIRDARKRQLDMETQLQDAAEARQKAMLGITGMADDLVSSAGSELALTRARLDLLDRQLAGGADAETRSGLLRQQVELLAQEAEGQRKVTDARRAAAELARALSRAEADLNAALAGQPQQASRLATATQQVAKARQALGDAEEQYARARQDYAQVASSANEERLKAATEGLTGAVNGHRQAVHGLTDAYRSMISDMDGVRDAGERLRQTVSGTQPFDGEQELRRLQAIQERRDAAQRALAEALRGADPAVIQKAVEELARQQERYNKQADLLDQQGYKNAFTRIGSETTQQLAAQVDALSIQYDRDAVSLQQRARLTDQEAENALTLKEAANTFDDSTTRLVAALNQTAKSLKSSILQARADQEREIAIRALIRDLQEAASRAEKAPIQITQGLQSLANQLNQGIQVVLPQGQAGGSAAIAPAEQPLKQAVLPAAPAPQATVFNNDFRITQLPGESGEALANRVVSVLQDRVRRTGQNCGGRP